MIAALLWFVMVELVLFRLDHGLVVLFCLIICEVICFVPGTTGYFFAIRKALRNGSVEVQLSCFGLGPFLCCATKWRNV